MVIIRRFLFCFGVLGFLASCMETTSNTPATNQAPSTVNTAVLKGSYRFVSECSGSGSFLTSCQKSGFSINDSGGLSGAYYGFTDLNNPHKQYFISIGSLRSNTTTETLIGRGGGKVQITRYHTNFSGRIVTDGVSRNVSGTAVFDPATSVITFNINSGSSFQGHRISRDGTTYWQRRSDEERAADEQNVREIQQSRDAAAAVSAGLGVGTGQNAVSVAGDNSVPNNQNHCITFERRSSGSSQALYVKNSCGQPVQLFLCASNQNCTQQFSILAQRRAPTLSRIRDIPANGSKRLPDVWRDQPRFRWVALRNNETNNLGHPL